MTDVTLAEIRGALGGLADHCRDEFAYVFVANILDPLLSRLPAEGVIVTEEELAAALREAEAQGYIAVLGTDTRTDAKGYPIRTNYAGVIEETAAAIIRALRGENTDPPHCICGADPGDPGCAAHGGSK